MNVKDISGVAGSKQLFDLDSLSGLWIYLDCQSTPTSSALCLTPYVAHHGQWKSPCHWA